MYNIEFKSFTPVFRGINGKNRLLVDVEFTSLKRKNKFRLLIDTGATHSTIDKTLLEYFEFEKTKERIMVGANGSRGRVDVIVVPHFTLGDLVFINQEIAVDDYSKIEGVYGLIGMDILGKYNICLCLEDDRLYYGKTSKPMVDVKDPMSGLVSNIENVNTKEFVDDYSILIEVVKDTLVPTSLRETITDEEVLKLVRDYKK